MLKRIMVVSSLLLLLLVGCTQDIGKVVNQTKDKAPSVNSTLEKSDVVIKKLSLNSSSFHFIVDWLSDTEIVFVEKEGDYYNVKTFDITTGLFETIYKESAIIADVQIHPTKKSILLHTTTDTSTAVVKIISLQGNVLDEVSIDSTELRVEWNQLNPSLVLLTAFYEDWSYDVFLYNGASGDFNMIPMEDPFPKWFGKEKVALKKNEEQVIDGNDLLIYDYITKETLPYEFGKVIYFDTYKDSILLVEVLEDSDAKFTISDQTGIILSSWMLPIESNFGEWVMPETSWLSKSSVVTLAPTKSGQIEAPSETTYDLVVANEGIIDKLEEDVVAGQLRCSADGKKCLFGQSTGKLIDFETNKVVDWLQLK